MVVPRTMESSTSTMRFPFTVAASTLSFRWTPLSRSAWEGLMKVLPMYEFL